MARFKNLSEKPQKFKLFYPVQELEVLPLSWQQTLTESHQREEGGPTSCTLTLGGAPQGRQRPPRPLPPGHRLRGNLRLSSRVGIQDGKALSKRPL